MRAGIFTSFRISASGLEAQRRKLDVIAENLANVETTRTPEGGPYRRKRAVLRTKAPSGRVVAERRRHFLELLRSHVRHLRAMGRRDSSGLGPGMEVEMVTEEDQGPFRIEYDPGHPDADSNGYVRKPNVNIVEEMVEMMKATRAYQANAAALEAAKDMFMVSLDI